MSYEDVDWTAEQVDFALQLILEKMLNGEKLEYRQEDYGRSNWTIKAGSKVYISVSKSWIFMILDQKAKGSFKPSGLFWKDRPVKASIKKLLHILNNRAAIAAELSLREQNKYKTEIAMKALFNAFPEAVTKEFEKHVLESKNGESKKD